MIWKIAYLLVAISISTALAKNVDVPSFLRNFDTRGFDEFTSRRTNYGWLTCQKCQSLLTDVISNITMNGVGVETKQLLVQMCIWYLPESRHTKVLLCPLLVETSIKEIRKLAIEGHLQDFCIMTGFCPVQNESMVRRPRDGIGQRRRASKRLPPLVSNGSSDSTPLTFVQLSDIHLDLAYAEGSPSTCPHKICCKSGIQGEGEAGRFGEYRCDAVNETVALLMDSIKQLDPPPSFFVYVGDSSPHSNGVETLEVKLEDNKAVNEMLVDYFRDIGPLYPTIGNHEMYPESIYNRRTDNSQAILASVSETWPHLFPVPKDQKANIRKHAFYTTPIKPGLRILTTNSLYGYTLNTQALWSLWDPMTKEQQKFVRLTLAKARKNKEKVIHVSHIKPSFTQTYPTYARFWERINEEFGDVIILQLYGHEHADNFVVSTSKKNPKKATGVFIAAPSITPFVYINRGTNPSFRVFKLDPKTFTPLDYDQYYVDLRKANEEGDVNIQKHYTFTEEYDVPDLSPSSFQTVSHRMEKDYTYYQKFERNFDVLSNHRYKCPRSNMLCRRILTCETRASVLIQFLLCLLGV